MWLSEDNTRRAKLVTICIIILLFGIFLGKNYTPTPVWFFLWSPTIPLIFIALGCFLLGGLCGWILAVFMRKRMEET